jgi:hypothetical protein
MYERIKNDLHRIAERIKHVNPKFLIFRNMATGKVEIHSCIRPCARSLEFVVPFDELDERTLEHAERTKIENFDILESEFAETNAELERAAVKSAHGAAAALGDMMKYAGGQIHEVTFKKNKRWF